jgi:hypothetical protein
MPLWCQGQHAPFVRLKRRFDSCRRLFARTPEAQRTSTVLRRRRMLVRVQPGVLVLRGRSSIGECRVASPEVPVRFRSSASTGPWCNGEAWRAPTSPVRVRLLVGLLHTRSSRAGAARLSMGEARVLARGRGFDTAPDRTPRPRRRIVLLRAGAGPVIASYATDAGSTPARSLRAPVAQWQSSSGLHDPRPQQTSLGVKHEQVVTFRSCRLCRANRTPRKFDTSRRAMPVSQRRGSRRRPAAGRSRDGSR